MVCQPNAIDLSNKSCVEQCRTIFNAYTEVISGKSRKMIRYQNNWSEYHAGNAEQLRQLYLALLAACPAAIHAGLPDLNTGPRSRRSPPFRTEIYR